MFLASPSETHYALSLLSSHNLANKKRKRRYFPNLCVSTSHRDQSLATATTGASQTLWPVALYVAAVVVYLWVYFLHPLGNLEDLPRWSLFTRLLLPEEILYRWLDGSSGFRVLVERLFILTVWSLFLGVAGVLGNFSLRTCRCIAFFDALELWVLSIGLGLSIISLFTLGMGLLGWLKPAVFVVPGALLLCFEAVRICIRRRRRRSQSDQNFRETASGTERDAQETDTTARQKLKDASKIEPWPGARWILSAVPFGVLIVLGACLPPVEFDVREYHLQVPKEWYQAGHIHFLPHNVYGNMPLGAQLLALAAMVVMPGVDSWWWGALVGKVLIASFALLGAVLLYAAGRRFCGTATGVLAGLLYISNPWVGNVSMHGLVEAVWGFYFFAAFYVLLLWWLAMTRKCPLNSPGHLKGLLVLAGLLAGAAVSCKYPAVLFVVLPLTGMIWIGSRRASIGWGPSCSQHEATGRRTPSSGEQERVDGCHPRDFAAEFVTHDESFHRGESQSEQEKCTVEDVGRGIGSGRPLQCVVVFILAVACSSAPWFIKNWWFTENPTYPFLYGVFGGVTRNSGKDQQWNRAHTSPGYRFEHLVESTSRLLWASKWQSPVLIPLFVLGLFSGKHRRLISICVAMIVFYLAVWWLFTHRLDRFLVPLLPLLTLIAALAGTRTQFRPWRIVMKGVLCLGILVNFLCFSYVVADSRFLVSVTALRDDPETVSLSHRYFNSTHFTGNKVLLVGDAEPFNLRVPALYNTCFDDCLFEDMMRDQNVARRRQILATKQISHVCVHWPEIFRYRATYGYSDYVQPAVFEELVQQGILETDEAWLEFLGPDVAKGSAQIVYRVTRDD